ncbi:MAG: pseudouridine synthase [Vicinamibacterales bacterium]
MSPTKPVRSGTDERGVRLQKLISEAGVASRRAAEQLILDGRVMVNGKAVRELGTRADPVVDDIRVDGRRLPKPERRYILMYKPRGYVSTRSDPEQRPTVIDLLERARIRGYFYPVGRLDYESDGLIILTNDGAFAERLMHPRYGLERAYEARVRGIPDAKALDRLRKGIPLDGERTQPAGVNIVHVREGKTTPQAIVEVVLREGRNRQVRRMLEAVGHPVLRLTRVRIGKIGIGVLKPGEMRDLAPREIASLTKTKDPRSKTKQQV